MAEVQGQKQPEQQLEQSAKEKTRSGAMAQGRAQAAATGPERGIAEVVRPDWFPSPFSMMGRLMGDMNRLFEEFGFGRMLGSPRMQRGETAFARAAWTPQVDVFEREGNLVIHADLPGLQQADVNVNVDDGVLTMSGERSHTHEHERGGVYRCERSYGSFQRSLTLPDGVDPESIQASFENGVLEVTMPMPQQQAPKGRTIPVRTAGTPETKH